MIAARLLPREEWAAKLAGTELEAVFPVLPAGAQVVAVEDGDRLVACWAVFPLVHVEGLWVDPEYRKNPRVGRRLLFGMQQTAVGMGARAVNTAAISEDVAAMLEKAGAVELKGRHFSLAVR
jgi:ribosomal protein S18 acetylase RimI-like enzyme